MVLFKDLSKASTDLLNKDYPQEKPLDLEYRYRGKNPQITNCASVTTNGATDASTTVKYSVGKSTTEIKVTATGSSTVDFNYDIPQVKGLSLGSRFERKNGKAKTDIFELSTDYKLCDKFHGKLQFQPLTRYYRGSAIMSYTGSGVCRFGAELNGKSIDISSLKYSVGGGYSKNDSMGYWNATIKTAPHADYTLGKIITNIYGRSNTFNTLNSSSTSTPTELAAEAQYNIIDGKTALSFGGKWYIGNENRDTHIKAKCTQDAKVSLVLSHRLSDNLIAAVGTQIDAKNFKEGESLRYGLKLNILA